MSEQPQKQDGQEDLAILYPEREAIVAGRKVIMREYGFLEGLRLAPLVAPIVDGMAALAMEGEITDPETLRELFAANAEGLVRLIATACDQEPAWVAALRDNDGTALQRLWWSVNGPFFSRRVVQSVVASNLRAFAGQTSTTRSPAPATTPTDSPSTPAES